MAYDKIRHITLSYDNYSSHPTSDEMTKFMMQACNDDIDQQLNYDPCLELNQADAEYWRKATAESKRLQSEMTEDQLKLLNDFEMHFPKSNLVDDV